MLWQIHSRDQIPMIHLQLTRDNSNLPEKLKKVRVIGSSTELSGDGIKGPQLQKLEKAVTHCYLS